MIKWVKLTDIRPHPNNPRIIKDDKFNKLKRSIIEFPEMLTARPLVCFTNNYGGYTILGGNQRYRALCDIGAKEVPIILADKWTAQQRDEFLIKDNLSFGEWNYDELANEWDADLLEHWGMKIPTEDEKEKPERDSCPTCGKEV
jgi:ParB-like chromosome segregation protein Spo0J